MNEYLEEKKMCKGCFKVGHIYRYCRKRRKCNKCKRWHPTVLHDDNLMNKSNKDNGIKDRVIANKINVNRYFSDDFHSMIVPVWLSHQDVNNSLMVYAVLDDQSDACFIKESILKDMNITG